MRRTALWSLAAAAAVGAVLAMRGPSFPFAWRTGHHSGAEPGGPETGGSSTAPEPIPFVTVARTTFHHSASQPGTVEPARRVDIFPAVSGPVARMAVDIGSPVARGDVLAEIDVPRLKIELTEAEAIVEQARARLETARSRVRVEQANLKTARAKLDAEQADLRTAEVTESYREGQTGRLAELVKKGSLQPRVIQEEQDRLRTTQFAVFAARARVEVERSGADAAAAQLETAKAQVGEAEQGLHIAEAGREKARLAVDGARLRSPIDGVVIRRLADVGGFVRSAAEGGTTPIVTVADVRNVRVVALVPSDDARFVKAGNSAHFLMASLPGAGETGKVARTAGAIDPATGKMRVEIDLPSAGGVLQPGQQGWVEIELEPQLDAITIPSNALVIEHGEASCYRLIGGRAVRTRVAIGECDRDRAVVAVGLHEGDRVVSDPSRVRQADGGGQQEQPAEGG